LINIILNNQLQDKVQLVISNNRSNDDTFAYLEELKQQNHTKLDITVFHQETNIGSVNNVLYLIHNSNSETVLFLGDDDFLDVDFLPEVIRQLNTNVQLSCIVPSNKGITEDGELIGFGRDLHLPSKLYDAGFDSCLQNAWRGHQLSGLVFKRASISVAIKQYGVNNLYLFIFIVGLSAYQGQLLHLTEFPVLVTRPPQNKKEWGYGEDGLISEIFDNFKRLPGLSRSQRTRLELKILDEQYWRYVMYVKKGLFIFTKAFHKINFGANTSRLTSVTFPFLITYFLIKRIILLSIQGDLIKTLKRPVDI
jgi:glycosyltransferase involved in cell wall biosynthesis